MSDARNEGDAVKGCAKKSDVDLKVYSPVPIVMERGGKTFGEHGKTGKIFDLINKDTEGRKK